MSSSFNWILDQFEEHSNVKKEIIDRQKILKHINLFSGIIFMNDVLMSRYLYPLDRFKNYQYIVFKLIYKNEEIHYANLIIRKNIPKFVCISTSYTSMDGEFHPIVNVFEHMMCVYQITKKRFPGIIEFLEDYFTNMLMEGKLILNVFSSIYSKKNNEFIEDNLLQIKFLIIAYIRNFYSPISEIHTNKKYVDVFTELIKNTRGDLESKIFKISLFHIRNFWSVVKDLDPEPPFKITYEDSPRSSCGMKILPILEIEMDNIMDINFRTWRELFINIILTSAAVNFISDGLPEVTGWAFIKNISENLYENQNIKERIEKNKKINFEVTEIEKHQNKKIDKKTSKQLLTSIKLLKSSTDLSKFSLLMFLKNKGYTVGNIIKFSNLSDISIWKFPNMKDDITNPRGIDYFEKLIFDLLLNLHIIHKKYYICHGDLHLHNMTCNTQKYRQYEQSYEDKKKSKKEFGIFIKDEYSIYNFADQLFIFRNFGISGSLIDFSRSIFGPKSSIYLQKHLPSNFIKKLLTSQRDPIISIITSHKILNDNKDILNKMMSENIELLFDILCLADFLSMSRSIKLIVADIPRYIKMLNNIEDIALSAIYCALTDSNSFIMPNFLEIAAFEKYKITEDAVKERDDIALFWNFDNEIKYDVFNYESLPPWLKIEDLSANIPEDIEKIVDSDPKDFMKSFDSKIEPHIK